MTGDGYSPMVTDNELISRALLDDDRHAFATLVRRYQSGVRNLLRRLTNGNDALADDLAQETFIKSYRSLATFRGNAKFSTWLYRIAYNLFISDRRATHANESYEDNRHDISDEGRNSGNSLLRQDLQAAMLQLGDIERVVIQMCCQCEFSHSETAQILQLPLGTVKTHVNRGKEKLRHYLAAWEEKAS